MKKFLSLVLSIIMALMAIPVIAEDFTFDIYDGFYSSDEAVLMEVDDSVKADFKERLISAWENMDTEVQLYPDIQIHKDDIVAYFSSVFFENPQYYYVARDFSITKNSAGYIGQLTKLRYTVDSMDEVRTTWAEIDKATEEILLYISPDMTDFEKIMTVHDYMDLHYVYDEDDMDQTYRIMLDKSGVCAAYAEAFQHVMNVLGIECTLVSSNEMGHIWNMVKVDNFWYHVDITWDDPVPDQFGIVCHEYMLLSENAIIKMGHTGFDAPYYAGKTIYNDAPWRDDGGGIVTIDGVMYRAEGNNLVDENDAIIYKNLDGGDNVWNLSDKTGIKANVFPGLCEINGTLYFNTDTGIYSYDVDTKEINCVLEEYGICGIFADKNKIVYNTYDIGTGLFIKKDEIEVCDVRIGKPYYEDGKTVVRLYNGCDVPLWIISKGDGYKIKKVDANELGTAKFENGETQTIYIWKNSLEPVFEKITVSK